MKRIVFTAAFAACTVVPALATVSAPTSLSALALDVTSAPKGSPELSAVNKDEGNLHWTLAPKAKYVKDVQDIFKKLQEGKYRKAFENMQELCEDSEKDAQKNAKKGVVTDSYLVALYPLWNITQCIAEGYSIPAEDRASSKYGTSYNPWHAYEEFARVCKNGKYLNDVQTFFVQSKLDFTLASIQETLEQKIIEDTRGLRTEETYDRLVATLYNSPNINVILGEREQVAFEQVEHTTRLAEAQRYLDKYDINSAHVATVTRLRDRLAFEIMPQNVSGCKDYLQKYPRSEYVSQVTTLLYDFAYSEMHGTIEGCRQYLKEYPQSHHCETVEAEIDDYSFQAARDTDSPFELRKYISQYPKSSHADEARQLLFAAEGSYFLRLDVPFSELDSYTDTYDALDERIVNFYNSLSVLDTFYENLEMKKVPKECTKVTEMYEMDYDEDYEPVRGDIYSTETEHFTFRAIGILSEQEHYSEDAESDEVLVRRTHYSYTIDEASGVIYPSVQTSEGRDVSNGSVPSSVQFTAVIANGFLTKLTASNGQVINYEYDEESCLKTKRIGTLKGAKLQDVTTYTYRDGHAVEARESDYHTTMTYNEYGDMISIIGSANNGGFADGAEWEISDYGPYGWTQSTMEYRGEEVEITRSFE